MTDASSNSSSVPVNEAGVLVTPPLNLPKEALAKPVNATGALPTSSSHSTKSRNLHRLCVELDDSVPDKPSPLSVEGTSRRSNSDLQLPAPPRLPPHAVSSPFSPLKATLDLSTDPVEQTLSSKPTCQAPTPAPMRLPPEAIGPVPTVAAQSTATVPPPTLPASATVPLPAAVTPPAALPASATVPLPAAVTPPATLPVSAAVPLPTTASPPAAATPSSVSTTAQPVTTTTAAAAASSPSSSSSGKKDGIVWKTEHFMNCYKNYSELISIISRNLSIVRKISELMDPSDYESFAKVVVTILQKSERVIPLLSILIIEELKASSTTRKFSVFRGNNFVSAVEKAFVRLVGKSYLWNTVGDTVRCILEDPDLDLEIDPAKLAGHFPDKAEMDRTIDSRALTIKSLASILVMHIVDPVCTEQMPKEMRILVAVIADCSRKYMPEMLTQLINGFLVLRVFSPAIVAPESVGIVPSEVPPSARGRRNLVLITKVLQTIANTGASVGKKESYMDVFADYIEQQVPLMTDFFNRLAQPYEGNPISVDDILTHCDQLPDPMLDIKDFSMTDLFEFHRVLYCSFPKLLPLLRAESTPEYPWKKALLDICTRLGPPPGFTSRKTQSDADMGSMGPTVAAAPAIVGVPSLETPSVDPKALEGTHLLYQGPSTPKGNAVFYLVMSRLNMADLGDIPTLMAYIQKVMDAGVQAGPYFLVIDMSWSTLNTAAKRLIYDRMQTIWKNLTRAYKKNIQKIVILQPDTFIQMCLFVARAFVSRKMFAKIAQVYDWKLIPPLLGVSPDNVALPDTAKHSVSKVYKVVKVNAHGKHQDRLIKFTLDSLLNLDPKGTKILNEKLLSMIDEIVVENPRSLEMYMRFKPEETSRVKYKFFGPQPSDERSYICQSLADRDDILMDIFSGGFRSGHASGRQEYNVVKVNGAGKHQDRIFKMTVDSLMNISGSDIRHEICFAGIDDVKLDEKQPGVVWMKYKSESAWRKVIMNPNDAALFLQNIRESIRQYRAETDDGNPFNCEVTPVTPAPKP